MQTATNENGSVYIGYDNRYRVSSFSDPFYYGISYNYDTVGNRTKLKLNGATYATYTYDAVNRLTNLADSANLNFPHSYDVVNRLTARTAPNSVTSNYAYDGLSRLTALTHMAGAATLIGNQYTHNNANNITNWTNASGNHAYGYDLVDRLTTATNSAQPNENYSYDGVGNRTISHLSASYGYQPFNKLTSTATGTYTYDNNGNLLSRTDSLGTTTFAWNQENRLTQVSLPGGLQVNYKYDGLGRRIQRTTSVGANERYVYDGHDVLLDLNADWSVATRYPSDLGIDNKLRQTSSTTGVSYYLTDHLGSTAGLTDPNGSIVEQISNDSFGNGPGSSRTRYGYTGRERDPDTGMLYYRARFYDPEPGRFISEDPIGFRGGINFYNYVDSNPIGFADPSGLCPDKTSDQKCDDKLAKIFGGDGAVASARVEPSDLRNADGSLRSPNHPDGLDRGDFGHSATPRNDFQGADDRGGIIHLYANAQGLPGATGLYAPAGFARINSVTGADGRPVPLTPGSNNRRFYRNNQGIVIAFVHVATRGVRNIGSRRRDGSIQIGNIGGPGGNGDDYFHTHIAFYSQYFGNSQTGTRIDPRTIFCKEFGF